MVSKQNNKISHQFQYQKNILLKLLKKIDFVWDYNQPLFVKLHQSLKIIHFGYNYNQPLSDKLSKTLEIIKFYTSYSQPLPKKLPNHQKTLFWK